MQSTGIVRRIDDLGRIVIPKEIRAALQLDYNDPIEISADLETRQIVLRPNQYVNYRSMWEELKETEGFPLDIIQRIEEKHK